MRAVVLESHGGPEVLTVQEVPDPVIGPEDLLVDVAATSVNRADVLQRMGLYPEPGPKAAHEIPGLEFAGVVAECGPRVEGVSVGDEVMGVVAGGGYATRIAVHHRQALHVPPPVGLPDAGAVAEVFLTAWDALVVQGGLTAGRMCLVHAGASGVGTAAIQVAKALGAAVAVTASAAKHDLCRELGADLVVDYRSEDFVGAVKEWSHGAGVDVVLDVIGGDYVARNLSCLMTGGTIVQVGVMGGGNATVPVGMMLPKRATLVGTVLRARPLEEKVALTQRFCAEVLPWFWTQQCRPVIDARYTLDTIGEAHARMESNANAGKLLVEVA